MRLIYIILISLLTIFVSIKSINANSFNLIWCDSASNNIAYYIVYEWVPNSVPLEYTIQVSYIPQITMQPVRKNGTNSFKIFAVSKYDDSIWSDSSSTISIVVSNPIIFKNINYIATNQFNLK